MGCLSRTLTSRQTKRKGAWTPCLLTSLVRKCCGYLVRGFLYVFLDYFLCGSILWCFINRVILVHTDTRPHLRRLSKVISASHCLSNSRQTPLVIRTKCLSPHSYVCNRLHGLPSFVSCIGKFSFYCPRQNGKTRITYHKVTFMCKTRQHNFCFGGSWKIYLQT